MNTATYDCSRCLGKGKIQAFSHVIAGVCFKCHGTGKQSGKPVKPSQKYKVFAREAFSNEFIHVFTIRAKTEEKALRIARVHFATHNTAYVPDSVAVEAAEDFS